MQIELSNKEFRRLLDLVYMGNWVLNSTRGEDRFQDYDDLESKLFGLCRRNGMGVLVEDWEGVPVPSQAYAEGGIHEAISYYEDNMFYEILAEELSRRDMDYADITDENYDEIVQRMDTYMDEFEVSGVDHLVLEEEEPTRQTVPNVILLNRRAQDGVGPEKRYNKMERDLECPISAVICPPPGAMPLWFARPLPWEGIPSSFLPGTHGAAGPSPWTRRT